MNKRAAVLHRPNVYSVSDSGQILMPWEEYKARVSIYEGYFRIIKNVPVIHKKK